MDNGINIFSYILVALSISVLVGSIISVRGLRKKLQAKDESVKLKQHEYDELRLLAAGVTHEIINALSVIMGRADQVLNRSYDPFQEKALLNIKATSDRIATSVSGLRQFLYPDTKVVDDYINLSTLMEDVLKLAGQRLRNHGIEIRLKGLENKVVKGRKSQLEHLIINLMNHAVERLNGLPEKWVQLVAVEEDGKLNIYFMDASGEIGDKISHKQFSDILEKNHGHLTVHQNTVVMVFPKTDASRFHA